MKKTSIASLALSFLFLSAPILVHADSGSDHPHRIVSISVCSPSGATASKSCPDGTFDTHQIVLAPDGSGDAINSFGPAATSDEHSSIFAPGRLADNADYLFFVASGVAQSVDVGVVVLSGGSGPNSQGQWTMDFASGYGSYPGFGNGQVFRSPTREGLCPKVPSNSALDQDQTFDLNYAAAGSVIKDPSSSPGHLFMIYEGSNGCIGSTGGPKSHDGGYITTGVATSLDYGHTWPSYRGSPYGGSPSFTFVDLPGGNPTQGPDAPFGALGASVCSGNDCSATPPDNYGRYATLTTPLSLDTLMSRGTTLGNTNYGDSEPSAFVDDVGPHPNRYVYAVHNYLPDAQTNDLAIARARLNGGAAPLNFLKWNGNGFTEPGLGGDESPLLPINGAFEKCADPKQSRHAGSISYVDETQQYLLVFICDSPSDPSGVNTDPGIGSAWFYSTSYDLSDPTQWSPAQEISGSWLPWDNSGGCQSYRGWYPTLMSLDHEPAHLSTHGYVFYMSGCQGGSQDPNKPKRQYSSRAFTITTGVRADD